MDIEEQPGRYNEQNSSLFTRQLSGNFQISAGPSPYPTAAPSRTRGQPPTHLRLLQGALFRYRLTPAFTSCSRLRRRARLTR